MSAADVVAAPRSSARKALGSGTGQCYRAGGGRPPGRFGRLPRTSPTCRLTIASDLDASGDGMLSPTVSKSTAARAADQSSS